MEELIPWLYLKGISTGDFSDALASLVGKEAPGLSAPAISRLKTIWQKDLQVWQKRDLSRKRYVYFWADGIYSNVRMDDRQCLLVIIGATEDGKKELVAIDGGFRESELSWTELLLDLKSRGLKNGPKLSIGDGSLGFWKAISKLYPDSRRQRCWVHKTANILNKLPKSLQSKAKQKLHDIWQADSKDEAQRHFDDFIQIYGAKYPKASECLKKDSDVLLTFYDFPAEHWRHIRTTEQSLQRLGALARASGIHLIIATQRPDSRVVTGLIKSNLPLRVALRVGSKTDSRIILDQNNAENLLGKGDLLLAGADTQTIRLQSPFASPEVVRTVLFP